MKYAYQQFYDLDQNFSDLDTEKWYYLIIMFYHSFTIFLLKNDEHTSLVSLAKNEATLVPGLTQMAKAEASRTQETEDNIRDRKFIQNLENLFVFHLLSLDNYYM